MQNCNFCKTILMLLIVLYHSGLFWTGNWFTATAPAQPSESISIFVHWLSTFHIYAFTLISGYIYYYVRYQRGGYNNKMKFIYNKIHRLIIPYIGVAILWVIPLNSAFYTFNIYDITNKFVLGEGPSQLWFLLMLFGVFLISYPLSNFFVKHPILSATLAIVLWMVGLAASVIIPNIFQICTTLQFILYFWLGFELRRRQSIKDEVANNLSHIRGGAYNLLLNMAFFILYSTNQHSGLIAKVFNIMCSLGAHITGALMAFYLLHSLARTIKWQTPILTSLSKASYPIYLFHQQIIYIIIWYLNGIIPPIPLMITTFLSVTLLTWAMSVVISKVSFLRPLIGFKYI